MNGPVHTFIGLSTGIIGSTLLYDKLPILQEGVLAPSAFIITTMIGATFPDLDLPGRPLGFLGHRKLTHTLLFPGIALAILWFSYRWQTNLMTGTLHAALFGWIWGYVSHIVADLFQRKGCPIFWPILGGNVHITNMPVKYDKIFLMFYILVLIALAVMFGGDNLIDFSVFAGNLPAIAIASVVAFIEIRRTLKKIRKKR